MTVRLLALSVSAALAAPIVADGQLVTVHESDPSADFADLHSALDFVGPGASILVLSDLSGDNNTYYYLDQAVSIAGKVGAGAGDNGRPIVQGYFIVSEGAEARLSALEIHAGSDNDALQVGGSSLTLSRCRVFGGYEHDCLEASHGATVVASECLFYSSGYDGLYTIRTVNATAGAGLVFKDCVVESGHPLFAAYIHEGATILHAGSQFIGSVQADGVLALLEWTLDLDDEALRIGGTIDLRGYCYDNEKAILLYSLAAPTGLIPFGSSGWFGLGSPFFALPQGMGSWSISAPVPDDDTLTGVAIYCQQLVLGSRSRLSCLELGVIEHRAP